MINGQVLDFTVSLHTEDELTAAHRKVVNAFREQRTLLPSGIRRWDRQRGRKDPTTAYVISEVLHHCRNAVGGLDVAEDTMIQSWLKDQPADVIVDETANIVTVPVLSDMANACDQAGDFWTAACIWGAAAGVALGDTGRSDSVVLSRKAMTSIHNIDMGASPGCSQEDVDQLEQDQLTNLAMGLDDNDMVKYFQEMKRGEYLLTTKAARANPQDAFLLQFFGKGWQFMMDGEMQQFTQVMLDCTLTLLENGVEHGPDIETRTFCTLVLTGLIGWYANTLIAYQPRGFRFSQYPKLLDCISNGVATYDYDLHHLDMVSFVNNDMFLAGPGSIVPIGLHLVCSLSISWRAMYGMCGAAHTVRCFRATWNYPIAGLTSN